MVGKYVNFNIDSIIKNKYTCALFSILTIGIYIVASNFPDIYWAY